MTTIQIVKAAKAASRSIANASTEQKNNALLAIADAIVKNTDKIISANEKDMKNAEGKISTVMLDRLMLNADRIKDMANGIKHVVTLDDPVGRVLSTYTRDDGLEINKVSCAMGVIAIIYESRPNVTSDAAALALKSGNACVLRCGKEAHASASAIVDAIKEGLLASGINKDAVMLVEDTSRDSATELMKANGLVDLLIPRGGKGLIQACVQNATVPCVETGTGICHVYVDKSASLEMALKIVNNAKTSRPSVCNAEEVLVCHRDIIKDFIPMLEKVIVTDRKQNGATPVTLKMDADSLKFSKTGVLAGENDFDTEFLDYILAVKTVDSVEQAVEHILTHSTGHSEAIVASDEQAIDYFTKNVDSSSVYVNASTRFTDGGEFGLGCEMGISTQKMHARGPMGLCELTTYKYIVKGNGNIR